MESFWYYWEVNDSMIDYFLIDYVATLAYDMFPAVQSMIEKCPISSSTVFELQKNLCRKFDAEKYKKWTQESTFFKLNWRTELEERTLTQEETFWGYLKDDRR